MGLGPEFALCGVGFVGCVVWVLLDVWCGFCWMKYLGCFFFRSVTLKFDGMTLSSDFRA